VFAAFNILFVRAVFAWIDRWLAQRRTREILGALFMVLLVSLLVINSVFSQKRFEASKSQKQETPLSVVLDKYGPLLDTAGQVQQWLPPGLSAHALQQAVERRPLPGFSPMSLLVLWVVLATTVLAARLKAQYRGQNLSWAPGRNKAIERSGGWSLGGSRPFAAVVEKELRSLMRTVPLLWALSMPLLLVLVVAGAFHRSPSGDVKSFPFAFPMCVAYALLGFTGLLYNNLGAEGAGIQLLFLSPTPIRTVLLAKNLLHSVLFILVAVAAGILSCARLGVPPFQVLAATGAWVIFALACNLAAGIIFSLTMPYRIHPGRITRPAGAQANTLPAMLIQAGVLGVGVLVFWLCWSWKSLWLPVPVFLTLAAGALFAWIGVLQHSDDTAGQYKDSLIATLMKTD
jgi:ABC-2 type transport system permease protein